MVFSQAVIGAGTKEVLIADVSRACMSATCNTPMHVELCEEDIDCAEDRSKRGRLAQAMHGTRLAARAWQA